MKTEAAIKVELTEYALSEVERTLLSEMEAGAQRAAQEAIAPFNAQSQGALSLIYRQQGLVGNWRMNEGKTALVRA